MWTPTESVLTREVLIYMNKFLVLFGQLQRLHSHPSMSHVLPLALKHTNQNLESSPLANMATITIAKK